MQDIEALTTEFSLFRDYSHLLLKLAPSLRQQSYSSGQALVNSGETMLGLILVRQGRMGHYVNQQKIAEYGQGDELGELSLYNDKFWEMELVAETEVTVIFLDANLLRSHCHEYLEQLAVIPKLQYFCNQQNSLYEILRENKALKNLDEKILHELEIQLPFRLYKGGSTLFHKGELSDSLYIVITGQLKAIIRKINNPPIILTDIIRGQSVGEIGLILHEPRTADVIAIRDTTVAVLNRQVFNTLLTKYPLEINRVFSNVILSHFNVHGSDRHEPKQLTDTFAFFPTDSRISLLQVAERFAKALAQHSSTCLIWKVNNNTLKIRDLQGKEEAYNTDSASTTSLLDKIEYHFSFIIYVSDTEFNEWSQLCYRQANQLLLVAQADDRRQKNRLEHELSQQPGYDFLDKHLIILQSDSYHPSSSRSLILNQLTSYYHIRSNHQQDYNRMARCFTGKAVGVVFGGGGARGVAHIGVIKALKELEIPIDYIGGNSIGAWIGGQLALNHDENDILKHLMQMEKIGERFNFPYLSLFSGKFIRKTIQEICGDILIEDLWTPFFSVSCNLTRATLKVHNQGLLWEAILASNSAPGIFPPQREQGDLLVDGALLNNVPVDVMKDLYKSCLTITVDVNIRDDLIFDKDIELTNWNLLKQKFNPWAKSSHYPNIVDLLGRSSIIGGLSKQNKAKEISDIYLQPPVFKFSQVNYKKSAEIAQVGYEYAMEALPELWRTASK